MRVDTFINEASRILAMLQANTETIMATQAEHAAQLRAMGEQLAKTKQEILDEVSALKTALEAGGGTTPEVDAAMQSLQDAVQQLDDLNPDAPAPAPAPTTP
jgi:chromosome segregation ATPase